MCACSDSAMALLSCACFAITANGVCLHLLVPPLAQCCFFRASCTPCTAAYWIGGRTSRASFKKGRVVYFWGWAYFWEITVTCTWLHRYYLIQTIPSPVTCVDCCNMMPWYSCTLFSPFNTIVCGLLVTSTVFHSIFLICLAGRNYCMLSICLFIWIWPSLCCWDISHLWLASRLPLAAL